MSAVFKLMKGMGANAVAAVSDTDWIVNFLSIDSSYTDYRAYPIQRPPNSGYANKSYESWLFLKMTQAPSNNVTNFRFWGPSDHPAVGVEMWLGTAGYSDGRTPSTASAICGAEATYHYSPGTSFRFAGTCSGVDSTSGFLIMQLRVYHSANLGNITGETMVYHLAYDES